jgi:hypothetical protein
MTSRGSSACSWKAVSASEKAPILRGRAFVAPERDVSFSGAGRTRTFLFYAAMVVIALGCSS